MSEDDFESSITERLYRTGLRQVLPNQKDKNRDVFLTQEPELVEHSCTDNKIETVYSIPKKKLSDHHAYGTVFSFEFKTSIPPTKKNTPSKKLTGMLSMNAYMSGLSIRTVIAMWTNW